jgi:hypothetical protein
VRNAQLPPDGRFVAYSSNEMGAWDVYVTAFPGPSRKWRVSHGGAKSRAGGGMGGNLLPVDGRHPDVRKGKFRQQL